MRFISLLLLALLISPTFAQENEAEKMFRAFEQKLRAAKALKFRFAVKMTGTDDKKGDLKGTLILAEGEKIWAEGEGKPFGEAIKFKVISDGITLRTTGSTAKQERNEDANAIGKYLREKLPSEGFLVAFLNMDARGNPDAEKYTLSDFKLGAKEKFGDRTGQAILWTVTDSGKKTVSMKLWLDTKTNLPLQLGMSGGQVGLASFTETYEDYTLDPKTDPKLFELPK